MIPASFVKIPTEPLPHDTRPETHVLDGARLSGRALVVEDNMIIALDAETTLENLGATRVDVAPNVSAALREIDMGPLDFAILDVNLAANPASPSPTG